MNTTDINYEKTLEINFPINIIEEKICALTAPSDDAKIVNPFKFESHNKTFHTFTVHHYKLGGYLLIISITLTKLSDDTTKINLISSACGASSGHKQIISDQFLQALADALEGKTITSIMIETSKGCLITLLFLISGVSTIIYGIVIVIINFHSIF